MLNIKGSIVVIISSIFYSVSFVADAVEKNASNNAALQQALERYSKQYSQEKNNYKLIYNLAVIHYKLKNYPQSKSYFLKLLPVDAYHLLAKYNLGLVANKQGNKKEAIEWFRKINAHQHKAAITNTGIASSLKKLALVQLNKLGVKVAANSSDIKKKDSLKTYLYLKYGYDDYVTDVNIVDTLGNPVSGDNFINLYGLITLNLDQISRQMKWQFSYYLKDFDDYNLYDYDLISTDLSKQFRRDNWRFLLRTGFSQSTYGSTDYQSVTNLELKSEYSHPAKDKLSVRYRYDDISSDDPLYNIYEGNSQRLDFQYNKSLLAHKFRVLLGFEANDRADKIVNGVVDRSYSASRTKIQLSWFYRFNPSWKSRIKYEYRDSLYNDFNTNPADLKVRDESREMTSLQIKYRIKKGWWWLTDYSYTDNQSNLARYGYTRNVLSTGVSGYF